MDPDLDTATTLPVGFPQLDQLLDRLEQSDKMQEYFAHNVEIFKHVHGGLEMVRANPVDFDPRLDFWRPPERRLLTAYFGRRWHRRYAPAAALRTLAMRVLQHFDRGRQDGLYDWMGVEYDEFGGWPAVAGTLIEQARRMPNLPEFAELRRIWKTPAETAALHVEEFLQESIQADDWPQALEPSLAARWPWFPYLGATSADDLRARQRFFYGYVSLLTATNAYRYAGAQSFATVIQNTPSSSILKQIEGWLTGDRPDKAGFLSFGRDDEEPVDRSHYSTVIELYGFVNLHRAPFINNRTVDAFAARFGRGNAYELSVLAGRHTRDYLSSDPRAVVPLAGLLREQLDASLNPLNVMMEGLDSTRAQKRAKASDDDRIDGRMLAELEAFAARYVDGLTDSDLAACALHLLVDAELYRQSLVESPRTPGRRSVVSGTAEEETTATTASNLRLPPGLRDAGERALGYLHAGLHVLFAGAPGTGKTTLAQIVGHAWDRGLRDLPDEIDLSESAMVTVGNSAWSPFHTIGGLRPTRDGRFEPHRGIFVEPGTDDSRHWQLRNRCIVLDEMNRADLDRCIGELYPLLSRSVHIVYPAGIPGVDTIEGHPRFRVIATVNDATLEDVVFPISEGLARRFQRIELLGATEADLLGFLSAAATAGESERGQAAAAAVREFVTAAVDYDLVTTEREAERLPFGAGYFALLKSWVDGELVLSTAMSDLSLDQQAMMVLRDSLSTLTRNRKLEQLLDNLVADA